MKDYRLSFVDESAWWAAADAQGWVKYEYEPQEVNSLDEPLPEPVLKRKWAGASGVDFDIIGEIYKPTGVVNVVDDREIPEFAKVPGWHVNVRFHKESLPEALAEFRVTPSNPVRTFAGGWFEGGISSPTDATF